jgi:hypothetical protein
MSCHPNNAYCPDCGGVDVTGLGPMGRSYSGRCRCDEAQEQILNLTVSQLTGSTYRVSA